MSTSQSERQRNRSPRKPAYRSTSSPKWGNPTYKNIRAKITGAHCCAVRERQSGDFVINLEYCGQSVRSLIEAANFFSQLASELSARRVSARA